MRRGCAITGRGLVTPLGNGVRATWDALLAGKFITSHARAVISDDARGSRCNQIALQAANEAIRDAGWRSSSGLASLVVGTSKGPIIDWITPPPHIDDGTCIAGGLSSTAAFLAQHLPVAFGAKLTLSAACASGLDALIRGATMIE